MSHSRNERMSDMQASSDDNFEMRAASRRDIIGAAISDVVHFLPQPTSGGVECPGVSCGNWYAREYFLVLGSGDVLWLTPDFAFRPLMIGPAVAVQQQPLRRCDYVLEELGPNEVLIEDVLVTIVDEVILRLSHEKYLWVDFRNEGPELLCGDDKCFRSQFEGRVGRTFA
jgi:hypothetical protein